MNRKFYIVGGDQELLKRFIRPPDDKITVKGLSEKECELEYSLQSPGSFYNPKVPVDGVTDQVISRWNSSNRYFEISKSIGSRQVQLGTRNKINLGSRESNQVMSYQEQRHMQIESPNAYQNWSSTVLPNAQG